MHIDENDPLLEPGPSGRGRTPGWRGIVECEVLEAREPSLLRYSWVGDENGAVSQVTYRLEPDHSRTRFTFEHAGFRGLGSVLNRAQSISYFRTL